MKTNICYVFATVIISLIVFISGCAITPVSYNVPTPPEIKTFTDQATWSNATKDKVFTACVTALHMTEFGIHPLGANKENGVIIPKPVLFYPNNQYTTAHYKLQILVLEIPDNKVMVDLKVKVGGTVPTSWGRNMIQYVRHLCSNRVADDVEKFFAQLNILLGKADSYRDSNSLVLW